MSWVRETSILAYEDLLSQGVIANRIAMVVEAIANYPGCTDREHCDRMGFADPNVFRPARVRALHRAFIEDAGVRECRVSGRQAHTWQICQRLLDAVSTDKQRGLF